MNEQFHPQRLMNHLEGEYQAALRHWLDLVEKGLVSGLVGDLVVDEVEALGMTWPAIDRLQEAIRKATQTGERDVPLHLVKPSRWQPREPTFDEEALWELARSIQEMGLINAVLVVRVDGHYELVAGERRTRALTGLALAEVFPEQTPSEYVKRLAAVGLAGLGTTEVQALEDAGVTIRARVESPDDLERLHRIAVMENLERSSLTPLEEARGLQSLVEAYDWSQRELARRIGRSQSYVAQRLRLLDLSPTARAAVACEALNTTHARAIGGVPEPLQEAVTTWTVEAVNRSDSPATTRQVANRARHVAAFVDPERWVPNGETVYRPEERNRLAAIRWALARADLAARSEAILGLGEVGYSKHNFLAKKPITITRETYSWKCVMRALGHDVDTVAYQHLFARETGRTCETCIFATTDLVPTDLPVHCPRWVNEEVRSCWGWIGVDDPVVIPVTVYEIRDRLKALDPQGLNLEPWPHFTDVGAYMTAYRAVARKREEDTRAAEERALWAHVEPMWRYHAWQGALEQTHFQAHACRKCVHYEPLNLEETLPPCRFVRDPLVDQRFGGDEGRRAPEFGALVSQEGRVLPRCEQFAYADLPVFHYGADVTVYVRDRERVLAWLMAIGKHRGQGYDRSALWGVLRWIPYERPRVRSQNWDRLTRWLRDQWDEIGDVGIAALFDAMISEATARQSYRGTIALYNPLSGEMETWQPVSFDNLDVDGTGYGRPYNWPEDWPDLWKE